MSAADWIAQRREVERCATSGPWHQGRDGHRFENAREAFTRKDMHDPESYDVWPEAAHPEDAAFVVDARTSLPLALDALEALLKGHRPVSFSFSWRDGVTMHEVCETCQDKAGVHPCGCWRDEDVPHVCAVCSDPEHRMDAPWPCMTVQTIESALRADA